MYRMYWKYGQRLSKSVKWIESPIMFESGVLYFALRLKGGGEVFAKARGKRRSYWLAHLLQHTNAYEVTILN